MSVNRETIEIQVSGLSQLNQLESTLLRAQGAADALSDAVGRVGGSLESATGRFTQTAQIERALRRTRRVAQQSLVDPRARRAMGSAGVQRRQADVENMSAGISELRERRRQERLDIAERRRRVANLSRRSAQRRQEAQAADRRLQAQERRILEINDQMTGQVSEARLGSRTERSRTLIRRRQLDAQRLRTSGLYNTGELGRAAAALEGRYEALNREILDLERAETVLRDSAQGVIRNLQRRRAQASSPALQQEIQQELTIVRSDLTRQLNAFQSQRQQLATNYGGLNEERRSINRTGRGRSVTFRAAESLNARADLLRNLYGASRDQTRVTIGGQRMQISEATRRAIEQANAGNTEAAKEILGFTSRRLTALEREINNTNKLADAEQRRLQIVQKLEDRFQQLRTANASGGNFQEFERLLGQVRELSGSRNMPLFNRIAAQASAAAGRVAIPKGFMRGPSSPIGGATFIPGSEKNIAARDIGSLTIEELQQRLEAGRRPGQPSFAFQRAESIIGRLQPLADANNFRQFDSLVKQARKALGIVASENKSIADATAERTRDEKEIEKITKKVLSGKRLEEKEVDRLRVLRPSASALPALPAAAPGTAAMGGRARPLRTQSTVEGVVQPLIQEILGGARTTEEAEATKRLADSFAVKAGKKAGPKFAQEFISGAADKFNAGQLLSAFGAAFNVFSDKSISKITRGTTAGGPRQLDPQTAQQRLARDLFAGQNLVGKLQNLERKRVAGFGAADPRAVEISQQVVRLETELNAAKQTGFELTKQNLDALTATINKSRQLLELDAQQNKLTSETAKIRRLQGERRLPQLQRDSLTSILGDLGRAEMSSKVFRGGRSGEQALSDIVGAFNASVGSGGSGIGAGGSRNIANMSNASMKELQLLSQALSETRESVKMTDKSFSELTQVLKKVDDQIARRDPNADFLTRRFGRRGGQAVGEGLIGGAFPLLFGQGAGAAAGGGLGGFLGGMAGGTLGFGLSLAGTAIGSQVDALMQATQDTGNMLRDLVGNFEQIKESGLLASRGQEKLIGNLLEAGNKTAAYAIIQDELNRKLGVDGAAKLREAADAGDRLKRAMADLGVQLQLFIAGPLTDFLNKLASVIEGRALENRTQDLLSTLPQGQRENLRRDLEREAKANSPFRGPLAFLSGFDPSRAGLPTGGGERSLIPQQTLRELIAKYTQFVGMVQQKPEEKAQAVIRDAQTRQAAAQRELEVFNKRNEGADILKGFKQQANAVRREQEDINRQSFELRRDYERQIEDIRRGVEDKISQLRQENAQKELEILVKQGQIREQQFKNAATTLQGALAGDPLAQSLADAVTTYLGAQLSAQNEIEQRRKQFEIEINNQQVELEKYKLDVARTISRLNTDTVEKVAQINLGIARRNEDAALNVFATEKKTAELRLRGTKSDLEALRTQEESSLAGLRSQLLADTFNPALLQVIKNYEARITEINKGLQEQQKILNEVSALQAPPKLQSIAPAATKGVSLAGVNAQKARGDQLRAQFQAFSDELTGLVETGNFAEFTNRISEIGRGGFDELSNNLDTARKELALVGGDFGPIAQGITDAYQKVIDDLPRLTAKLTPELQAQVPALKKYLEVAKQSQIQLERLRPTLEFYITGYGDLKSQTEQAKNSISELLSPTKNYDRLLEQINKRGGLGINEEKTRRLLQAARNLDELNARLKVLNGLNDIAGGWTDSFIQLNKELLKGGNLLESVQRFAEGVADRTLDVVLEFTLRPIQEQLFKNLSKVLGIEAPQDPTLLPIKETAQNTKDLVDLQKRQFAGQTGIKLPEPANNIVAGPSAAPAASVMTGRYMQGNIGPTSTGPHFHVMRQDGSYYPKNALDQYVEVNGRPLSSVPVSRGQEYGAPREYGPHTGRDYAFPNGASLGLMNGAKWIGNTPGTSVGDRAAFMTPDGKIYEIIHGRFKGEAKPIAPVAQQPAAVQAAAGPIPAPVPSGVTPDGRQYFPIPAGAPGSPNNPASPPVDKYVEPTTNASNKAADSIANLDQKASAAADGLQGLTQQTSETVTKFQTIVGTSLQAISSIAMGIGGAQMIRKGGAYNTLMGAASIFGSISSITGMFGKGGSLAGLFGGGKSIQKAAGTGIKAFASGGRPDPYDPAIIGENGPELWVPDRPGTIIPNDELYVPGLDDKGGSAPSIGRYARRAASSMESGDGESGDTIYTGNYGRAVPYQRSETTREIDRLERITTNPKELPPIKYETTRVNEYDFVTPEQLEASNARTAKIARNQTIRELADSMKTRKRLGL